MSIKVSVWDKILKVIIAVASAIAGVIGGQVMAIQSPPDNENGGALRL